MITLTITITKVTTEITLGRQLTYAKYYGSSDLPMLRHDTDSGWHICLEGK